MLALQSNQEKYKENHNEAYLREKNIKVKIERILKGSGDKETLSF